jgi:uncharacterized Zn-binding protein involved in type VI secretion
MKTGDTTVICTEEGVVEISNGSSMIKVNGSDIVMSNGSASISIGSSGISLNGGTINLNGSLNLGVSTSNPVGSESSIPTDLKG